MDWISLALPFAYLIILVASLYTFSTLYRARQAARERSLAPWFPQHVQRNVYLSLLEVQARPDVKVPDSILKAALIRRATESVHRLLQLRNSRNPLQALLQRGSVGEELWQRFLIAEKEMEAELQDIMKEANALAPNQEWGRYILQSASESAANEVLRRKVKEIEERRGEEKERWQRRRENVRENFMKELESDNTGLAAIPAENEKREVGEVKKASSDEDGVLVENPSLQTPGSGSSRKKKGKK